MKKLILTLALASGIVVTGIITFPKAALALPNANLGQVSPRGVNSDPTDAHVHYLRNGLARDGIQDEVRLKAYYPADVSGWGSLYFEFNPGHALTDTHVCNTYDAGMTAGQRQRFVHVILSTSAGTRTYYIPESRVCVQKSGFNDTGVNSTNAFYARYSLPPKPAKSDVTDMLEVDIWIRYDDSVPNGDNGVRFRAAGPNGSPKIGPLGGGGRSFPLLGDWSLHDTPNRETRIAIPFGASCDLTSNPRNPRIRIYDADNGSGFAHDVNFRVKNITTGNYERFNDWGSARAGRGTVSDGGTRYRPPSGNADAVGESWVQINQMVVGEQYQMEIFGLNPRNTVDISVPGDTIFGDISCPGQARIFPRAGADETVQLGQPFRFENWAETRRTERTGSDTFRVQINDVTGNLPAGADWGAFDRQINPNRDVPDGRRYYDFLAPSTGRYCLETRISRYPAYVETPAGTTARQCLTVVPVPPRTVNITPNAFPGAGGTVEAEEDVPFSGNATVTNFPETRDFGYNDQSRKLSSRRVEAQPTRGPYDYSSQTVSAQSGPHSACSNGGDPSRGCVIPGGTACNYTWRWPEGLIGCPPNSTYTYGPSYGYVYYYYICPSGGYSSNGNGTCTRTTYRCTETGGAYTYPAPSCRTYYECEGGVANTGWHYSRPLCNRWYCQYPDSPAYPYDPSAECEYRCQGGTAPVSANPGRALLTTNHVTGAGDRNCYVRPNFTITCQWTTQTGAVLSTHTDTVTANGTWCSSTNTRPPGNIGDRVCLRYRATNPGVWNTNPPPGTRNGILVQRWGWNVAPPSEACVRVVGKPYLRVLGDVSAGAGPGTTASTCTSFSAASVSAQNKGASEGYSGAGASVGVFASGTVNSFASGQFATPILGTVPKALTFANVSGTYGGGWRSSAACFDTSKFIPTTTLGGGSTINATTINGTQRYRVNGNVYIRGNMTYATNVLGRWTSIENIPLFQLLVVGGNIYIDNNVTQLDGTYIALPVGSTGGNIYTCASGMGSEITSTWNRGGCNEAQLVVNGSLVANKVHFGRDCSTLNRSSSFETSLFTGGTDQQECDPLGRSKAAEVINYLPDQWIRSSVGIPSTRYDAITSMPPIL